MRSRLVYLALCVWIPTAAAADCPDYAGEPSLLMDLEQYATRGALNDEEKGCLESNFAKAEEQTTKDKISRVLMVNGYAYSTAEWAELVKRHLDEVDRSDPDIAYLYAHHLFNTDPDENAEKTIRWAEVALERKDFWEGDVHVARVYGLMRLRAYAAHHQWARAEEARLSGGSDDLAEGLRNDVKVHAREWIDLAKSSKRDPAEAFALCSTVASARACGGAPEGE